MEMKIDNHMLKNFLEKHEGENMEEIKFGMKILKTARSAFERQIAESVLIQTEKRDNYILNSKSEYNRCALPRLTAKIGNFTLDDLEKEKQKEKETERELVNKIRDLKVKKSRKKEEKTQHWRECQQRKEGRSTKQNIRESTKQENLVRKEREKMTPMSSKETQQETPKRTETKDRER